MTSDRPPPEDVPQADAWGITSTLISGVLLWGGIGWLLDRWLHTQFLVGIGIILGAAASIYLVWLRYGRQQ